MAPLATPVHEVMPNDSCIHCARKHVSVAWAEALSAKSTGVMIGELELARRHTLLEYPSISESMACALVRMCARDIDGMLDILAKSADSLMDDDIQPTPGKAAANNALQMNPFLGELHLCAAWRLASEVGYMVPNRMMIIGDLALATENLVRFEYSISTHARNLRHRVQTTRAADFDTEWSATVSAIGKFMDSHLDEYRPLYLKPFSEYLGVSDGL